MPRMLRSAFGVSHDLASFAVVEINDDVVDLIHLEEERGFGDGLGYLSLLSGVDKKLRGRLQNVYFAFDGLPVFLHPFPIDSALSGDERDEQLAWEIRQFLPAYSRESSPTKVYELEKNAAGENILACVQESRGMSELGEELAKLKLKSNLSFPGVIAAAAGLYRSHPEERSRRCVIISVAKDHVEYVLMADGEPSGYRYLRGNAPAALFEQLKEALAWRTIEMVYVFGDGLTLEWTKMLRAHFGRAYAVLNPFRRIRILPTVHNFSRFLSREHRFAATIGALLSD